MYYLFLGCAALCIAAQFSLTKVYQSRHGSGTASSFFFSSVIACVGVLLFLCLNRFSLRFSGKSVGIALGVSAFLTANNVLSVIVVKYGDVSVYTVFMMLGGMLLPYVCGLLFWRERTTVCGIIGIAVLTVAVVLQVFDNIGKGKADKAPADTAQAGGEEAPAESAVHNRGRSVLFTVLCLAVFCLNGLVSIFSKMGRITADPLPVYDFMIWNYLFSFGFSAVLTAFIAVYRKCKKLPCSLLRFGSRPSLWLGIGTIVLVAGIGSAGYLLQLVGAEHLPAVVLYPIVSGGTVLLTAVAGRLFFGEKITRIKFCSLLLTTAGTVLFLF